MIIISLDENGDFEEKNDNPVFIAGILYDDNDDSNDIAYERLRIAEYYKKVIEAAKANYCSQNRGKASDKIKKMFKYPQALHFNDEENNNIVVKYVKETVRESFREFISSCSFKGEQISIHAFQKKLNITRKGQYHLFVMLKGKDGIDDLKNNSDNLINDDFASNLYYHMASRVVNRLIFHNPIYLDKMPEIRLNIATRVSHDLDELTAKNKTEQYDSLGYVKKTTNEGKSFFSLMNADIYRTLIAEEMLRCKGKNIRISEFSVCPIKYQRDYENGFAYLADSLCAYLGFNLVSSNSTYINEINKRIGMVNPGPINLVFAYDKVDVIFGDAVEALEKGDLYSALSSVFDINRFDDDYAQFYQTHLFGRIINSIHKTENFDLLEDAIDRLRKSITSSNLDNEKFRFIFDNLKEAIQEKYNSDQNPERYERLWFKMWETGISACSHTGDPSGAVDCYNECSKYFRSAGIDEIIRLNNKMTVAMVDLFSYSTAEKFALENISLQDKRDRLLKDVLQDDELRAGVDKGKAISQYAQVLAATRNPDASASFREALGLFTKMSPNYKITQSFLLHHLIDMAAYTGDKKYLDTYETEATDYFGGISTYINRLKYVNGIPGRKDELLNKNFAYYVLFRGMYISHIMLGKRPDNKLFDAVKASGFSASADGDKRILSSGHPWEITYKYLRMLSMLQGDYEYEQYCKEQQKKCLRYKDKTIEALMMYGDIQVQKLAGDALAWEHEARLLAAYLKKHFIAFKKKGFSDDRDSLYIELSEVFTFMYQ